MDHLKLSNPPITEALLDIQVELGPEFDLALLGNLKDVVKETYPNAQQQNEFKAEIRLNPGGRADVSDKSGDLIGYRFITKDNLQVFQARKNGFTLNRLNPYVGWELFSLEAKRLWDLYSSASKPQKINRVGLRFINLINLDLPVENIEDYFLTFPKLGNRIPQHLGGILMRVVIPCEDGIVGVVTMANQPTQDPKLLPIILDIEVSMPGEFDPFDKAFWITLDKLRNLKNEIFFGSLTEMTLEKFR